MSIETQFNRIAAEYDGNRQKFIPCFRDFYETTTAMIASNITAPARFLDLGAGTGLLSYFWFRHFPATAYVLVDIADEMLQVARKRFAGAENVSCQILDYTEQLPEGIFDVVGSALSVHHLEHADKQRLFSRIYDRLPEGGLFVNYDQFCAGTPELDRWFDTYWEAQLAGSGLTEHDIALWQERRKLDRECSVEQETEMLHRCGFRQVRCLYSYHKFSVITAIK